MKPKKPHLPVLLDERCRVLGAVAPGDAVQSAEAAVPSDASTKDSQHEGASVGEGRPDSSTIEPQVQAALLTHKGGCACTLCKTAMHICTDMVMTAGRLPSFLPCQACA